MDPITTASATFMEAARSQGRKCEMGAEAGTLRVDVPSQRGPLDAMAWFSPLGFFLTLPYLDELQLDAFEKDNWKFVAIAGLNFHPGIVRYGLDVTTGEIRVYVATLAEPADMTRQLASDLLTILDKAVVLYEETMQPRPNATK